jgi:tetratricopeptide (TPR) repeat protein
MTATWALVCLLGLTPQVFYLGSRSPFLLTKALYLYLVGSFACLFLALSWRRDPPRAGLPRALLAPALFVAYAAVRAPWFADTRPEIAAPFLWGAFLLAAWPIAGAGAIDPTGAPRVARLLVVLGGLTGAYALLQAVGVDLPLYDPGRSVLSASFTPGAWQPPFATLGNPNFLGEYLAGLLPLAVAGALGATGPCRWVLAGAGTIMAAALPLTLARAAWLGAVVGLGVTFLARPAGKLPGRRLSALALAMLTFALAAALAMGHWTKRTSPWHKLAGTWSQLMVAGEGRRLWWGATVRMVADHPWAGVGEGRFREAYPAYQGLALASLPNPQATTVDASPVESPHSDYLHAAAELGIPGLLLLLGTLGLILADGFRGARRAEGSERALRAGGLGGLAALLVAGLFGFPLHTASGLFMAAALSSFAVPPAPTEEHARPAPRWQWVLLVGATALGFWQTAHLLRVYAASLHLHRGTEAFLRRDIPGALEAFERAREACPRDSDVRATLGRAYLAAGHPDLALPHLAAGLRGFDSSPLRLALGRAYLALGQVEAAEGAFRAGVTSFPGYAPLHLSYAGVLAGEGRDAEASQHLARALAGDPKLADAHYLLGTLRAREGDHAAAAAALRRFLELARPGDPRIPSAMARLAEQEGAPPHIDNGEKPVK